MSTQHIIFRSRYDYRDKVMIVSQPFTDNKYSFKNSKKAKEVKQTNRMEWDTATLIFLLALLST